MWWTTCAVLRIVYACRLEPALWPCLMYSKRPPCYAEKLYTMHARLQGRSPLAIASPHRPPAPLCTELLHPVLRRSSGCEQFCKLPALGTLLAYSMPRCAVREVRELAKAFAPVSTPSSAHRPWLIQFSIHFVTTFRERLSQPHGMLPAILVIVLFIMLVASSPPDFARCPLSCKSVSDYPNEVRKSIQSFGRTYLGAHTPM